MVKKKFSGQTLAIILLAVLLSVTVCFGGVYAYYSQNSSKISGKIKMANLKITMQMDTINAGGSGSSEILISNGLFVPGNTLENSPLKITNYSNTKTYIAIIYKVNAYEDDKEAEGQNLSQPLIDIIGNNGKWYDYLYKCKDAEGGVIQDDGQDRQFRVLISTSEIPACAEENSKVGEVITVIGENCLQLSKFMGNEFQGKNISFTFQAYAIGSGEGVFNFTNETTQDEKSEDIMNKIHEAYNYDIVI